MRMRWKQDRYLWRKGPASISEKIFVSLVCTASPGDTIVQNLSTGQFVYIASLHFQKGFVFTPQISFSFFILRSPASLAVFLWLH